MPARDEFSCPCCGVPTDSSYCAACEAAECGEQDVSAPDVCLAEMAKQRLRDLRESWAVAQQMGKAASR